jgi:hypothetical protein
MIARGLIVLAFALSLPLLSGCDRTPPSNDDMREALQRAIDAEAEAGGSALAKVMKIAKIETTDCEFTAMVGKPIYKCDVSLSIGPPDHPGPMSKPKPVMFHKSGDGWIVPN